ncbi:tetratricopeptide repeat protein [Paenibacillus sp. TRM 82003]|nr:tetratricopeptide repeat protein [Paenibacillus sp. TRM 82003]
MPPILKVLIVFAAAILLFILGFRLHWAIGTAMVLALLAYGVVSNRSTIYAFCGNIAYMKGDSVKALSLLEKAHAAKSAMPQHMIGYAYLLMKTGDPARGEQILNEVLPGLREGEAQMQARVNLATAHWLLGRPEEAVQTLEAVHEDYKNTIVYGNLGYFRLLRGEVEEVLAFNEEAYEYNDNDLTILDNLALNYYRLGRYEEAAEMYVKVMAKTPKHAESYYYYALTLEKLDRGEEAREQARIAADKPLALVTDVTAEDLKRLADAQG